MKPVKSSNIASIGYEPASKTMNVKFLSGATHQYAGVPVSAHAAFAAAKSFGSHFAAKVRGKYPSKKLC